MINPHIIFGSNIYKYIDYPVNEAKPNIIRETIDAISIWESRIEVNSVLVDIEMPKMDGYTFASEVRKYNKFKNLPLIAVTSRNSKTDRMRGVESGMTEYITKPYTPEYLVNVVRRNINLTIDGE